MTDVNRLLDPLRRKLANMLGRAVLALVDDTKKMQTVQIQVLSEETREAVERFQNFGFTSVPKAGAECIAVFVGGDRGHPIVVAIDDRRYRLVGLADGEVAMYNEHGDKVHFRANRDIEMTTAANIKATAGGTITLDAPTVAITHDCTVGGTLTATTDVVGGNKHLKTHVHSGVTAGGANTGQPV